MEITEKTKIKDFQEFLKSINSSFSLGTKEKYIERVKIYNDVINFPWRDDQKEVLEQVIKDESQYYVINGIFGCGKTTLLFGIMINLILNKIYKPDEIMFISFNVCIKNELKRKLKPYGFKGQIKVSTFDSIIYFICKHYEYPHLDLPNFDGKRRFCQKLCEEGKAKPIMKQPKIIFIDEVQDLECTTFNIFNNFYPNTKIIFAGDVFQSIQKEPRDSLLWYLLNIDGLSLEKFYMKITPRVPKKILINLQKTLIQYYPEFAENINEWTSDNTYSDAKINWHRFYSYSQIYEKAKEKIEEYGKENTMILVYSSAITVKGNLGDIARLRRNFILEEYEVNKNHKKLEPDKLFLSTANSSKGLERDHVVIFLTFPLEKAFCNFSNDIVMNLITVGITRARKTVDFYVPAYEDKFTNILNFFDNCPKPNKEKIRECKTLEEFTFQDYMECERCVTELIRQSIIFYDTRIAIKNNIKFYNSEKCFDGEVKQKRPIAICEEEQAMVGIIIENLMTSTWSGKWPFIDNIDKLKSNPMYVHVIKKIENMFDNYKKYIKKSKMNNENQFDGIFMYSQLHLAIYNKLFITFTKANKETLRYYWYGLKPKIIHMKPKSDKLFVQANLGMPYLTGIADAIFNTKNKDGYDEINIWEIKASISMKWKDDAMTQAFLYALMCGKIWSRITLINPFCNEKSSYYFDSKNIMSLRNKVYQDILIWNFNCFLAKTYNKRNPKVLRIDKCYFALENHFRYACKGCGKSERMYIFYPCKHQLCEGCKKNDECLICSQKIDRIEKDERISQLTIIEFLTPSKTFVHSNKYFKIEKDRKLCTKLEKLCLESEEVRDEKWREKLNRDVWLVGDNFNELVPIIDDWKKEIKYVDTGDINYGMDFDDGLILLFCYLSLLSKKYKFI